MIMGGVAGMNNVSEDEEDRRSDWVTKPASHETTGTPTSWGSTAISGG